jgi:Zn-dependent protease
VLTCPACNALVHAEELKTLAATADERLAAGDLPGARTAWERALELLPSSSRQHQVISERVTELTARIKANPSSPAAAASDGRPWWQRGLLLALTIGLFTIGKFKFLLLGLTKASTFVSMFAFFGVYWAAFGWALAAGLVVSIYIHEMGHVHALRRLGIAAGAPLFIPGLGALVLLKKRIEDPIEDARVGLAGPIWGLGAAIASYGVYRVTEVPLWAAIAQFGAYINLFNLIPFWQLDGARGFHALSSTGRWIVVAAIGFAWFFSGQMAPTSSLPPVAGLLIIVGAVAAWRAWQPAAVTKSDEMTLATFLILIGALTWLAGVEAL